MRPIKRFTAAMSAIQFLQSNINMVQESNFKVDPLVDYPKINSLKLSGYGLDDSDFKKLIPHLQTLHTLKHLDLSNNEFTRVPEGLNKLSSLVSLNLENNDLVDFHQELEGMNRLEELRLGQNSLERLTKKIGNLPSLRILKADRNQLRYIPEKIGDLKSLEKLVLSANQIREIPSSIGGLQKLRSLKINYNQLRFFPEEIGQLKQLVELIADRNLLKTISDEIGNLSNLKILCLWGNLIETVTPNIGNLKKLKRLAIDANKIEKLPNALSKLDPHCVIDIGENPIAHRAEAMANLGLVNSKKKIKKNEKAYELDCESFFEPNNPYGDILTDAKPAIEAITRNATIPNLELESPLFDSQKQTFLLAQELHIISKYRDKSEQVYKAKGIIHAQLFINELRANTELYLSDATMKNESNLAFYIPKNSSKIKEEKKSSFVKKDKQKVRFLGKLN